MRGAVGGAMRIVRKKGKSTEKRATTKQSGKRVGIVTESGKKGGFSRIEGVGVRKLGTWLSRHEGTGPPIGSAGDTAPQGHEERARGPRPPEQARLGNVGATATRGTSHPYHSPKPARLRDFMATRTWPRHPAMKASRGSDAVEGLVSGEQFLVSGLPVRCRSSEGECTGYYETWWRAIETPGW